MNTFRIKTTYTVSHVIDVSAETEEIARDVAAEVAAEYQSNTSPGVEKGRDWLTEIVSDDSLSDDDVDFHVSVVDGDWVTSNYED